jgi:hypothetical protein
MARENKQKRAERRYGSARTIADLFRGSTIINKDGDFPFGGNNRGEGCDSILIRMFDMSVKFDVTNVPEYFTSSERKTVFTDQDYMNIGPIPLPFPTIFFGAWRPGKRPASTLLGDCAIVTETPDAECLDRCKQDATKSIEKTSDSLKSEFHSDFKLESIHKSDKCITIDCFIFGKYSPPGTRDANGTGILYTGRSMLFMDHDCRPTHTPMNRIFQDESSIGDIKSKVSHMTSVVFLVIHSIMLANCRNITLKINEPAREFQEARRRDRVRPLVSYRTIHIDPNFGRVQRDPSGEIGSPKPLHVCRGHFATYSEDRPLFGRKGLHGRFWVPAHVRGSEKHGIVISDYNVKGM